ncbi:hypothetical protein N9W89_07860 [Hellea sp.]|nr:hypothetical protein [Hellea sp.]
MPLILAHKTNSPADAVVIYSLLEAGGFHPTFQNYYHGFIAIGYLGALDGIQIMLPSQEIEDAKVYIKETKAITDFDPIKNRWIRDLIQASVLTMNPFFFIFLLSPFIQIAALILLITLDVLVFSQGLLIALLANITFAFFIIMLAHAKYVAVPKLRETP